MRSQKTPRLAKRGPRERGHHLAAGLDVECLLIRSPVARDYGARRIAHVGRWSTKTKSASPAGAGLRAQGGLQREGKS